MSERDGSDEQQLWNWKRKFKFRVVVRRIRLFPTLISKIKWLWFSLNIWTDLYIISTIRFLTSGLDLGPRYFGETTRISSFKNLYFPISLWNNFPEFRTHTSSTYKYHFNFSLKKKVNFLNSNWNELDYVRGV